MRPCCLSCGPLISRSSENVIIKISSANEGIEALFSFCFCPSILWVALLSKFSRRLRQTAMDKSLPRCCKRKLEGQGQKANGQWPCSSSAPGSARRTSDQTSLYDNGGQARVTGYNTHEKGGRVDNSVDERVTGR